MDNKSYFDDPLNSVWDENDICSTTGTKYNESGFDRYGYNLKGFNINKIHKITGTLYGPDGYNIDGYDKRNFDRNGIHKDTNIRYNKSGYNQEGYNFSGEKLRNKTEISIGPHYNPENREKNIDKYLQNYDSRGFLENGIHIETGELYDTNGYDKEGFDKNGIHKETKTKYSPSGYDKEGYDKQGFNKNKIHKETKTLYDKEGYDKAGYDIEGYNKEGLNKKGKTKEEVKKAEIIRNKKYLGLIDKTKKLADGKMTAEEFLMSSKVSIDEIIKIAKNEHFNRDQIYNLMKIKEQCEKLKPLFDKEKYINEVSYVINGEEVKPTEEDVNKCLNYMNENNMLIRNITARRFIKKYLEGKIDLSKPNSGNQTRILTREEKIKLAKEEKIRLAREKQRRKIEELKKRSSIESQNKAAELAEFAAGFKV